MTITAYPRRAGAPTAEPVTLAEALLHLRADADGGANDAYVNTLVSVARETCEERIRRTLITTAWRLTLDGFPEAIQLSRPPVIAVQSLTYLDATGVVRTLDPADYLLDSVSEPGYLVPAYEKQWPETRDQINSVVVNYTAGYGATAATVPKPIYQWLLLAVGEMYGTRKLEGERPSVPHGFAQGLLDPYQIWGD
jgi:uncharacterized phiE125 gp8 family phage protein